MREDGDRGAADVREETHVGFGVPGVVDCGFLGGEVEAEESGAETPGWDGVSESGKRGG